MDKVGDLKVWWEPQVGANIPMFEIPAASPHEGAKILNVLADYDLFQFENRIKPDYANTGGLAEFDGKDWYDWEDAETGETDPVQWAEDNGAGV